MENQNLNDNELELKIKATNVFKRNYQSTKRIVVNQGGTGSSKTYSLAQLFIMMGLEVTGSVFSIVRKSMPSLRATAMRDFFNILMELDLYNEENHEKTNNIYHLNGNEFEFFGLDEPQKVRSRRRDYLWINEGNELSREAFRQLNMRTNKRLFIDFNPSDEYHWIYDDVLTREDVELIISTYKDNPFLPEAVVKEIERFKEIDENYWNIYGLGQVGVSSVRIYTKYYLIDKLPEGEEMMGLDFGFNHPTSLVDIVLKDDDVYADEVIYESHLTNDDLINKMNQMKISKTKKIYADAEDPARIMAIKNAGYNIVPALKDAQSVKNGIDFIKARKFYITKRSTNGIKEVQTYSWKTKGEQVLDEPVKLRDDFVDSVRYPVYTYYGGPKKKPSFAMGGDVFGG
jgi:phage terminase large subunit